METGRKRWSERFGEWGTATHARRLTAWVVLLLLGCVMTVLLVTDPGEALSGTKPYGAVLAPVLVVLMVFLLWREVRTGDSRK